MTNDRISPIIRAADGSIDVNGFAVAGVDNTTIWLRAHLLSRDPLTSFGDNFDESPHRFVVALLRKIGLGHPSSVVIGESISRLLSEATHALPSNQRLLSDLLAICRETLVPDTAPWFVERLERIASDSRAFFTNWIDDDIRKDFVSAAALQIPAGRATRFQELWDRVIEIPELATVALFAYGLDFVSQLPNLQTWWNACPQEIRSRELQQLIETDIRNERSRVLIHIAAYKNHWKPSLKDAVDHCLIEIDESPVFKSPLFTSDDLPKELVHAQQLLAFHQSDEEQAERIKRVLSSSDITVVKSLYTGIRGLAKLHNSIILILSQFGGAHVHYRETGSFEELSDILTCETTRLIFTFPLYLTEEKRKRLFVIPYGKQEEVGLLIPNNSYFETCRLHLKEAGKWNLASILGHTVNFTEGLIYCPSNYAMSEIVVQCAAHFPSISLTNTKRIHNVPLEPKSSPSRRSSEKQLYYHAPREAEGSNWIYLFDLGDLAAVEQDIQSDQALEGATIHRLPHELNIPVGVGFNIYMVPWLIEHERWKLFQAVIDSEIPSLTEPLRALGIRINPPGLPVSPEFLRK